VRSRLASTIQPAPAALLRPVPTTRWYFPSAGACLTRHHRGFIRIHPSALPQPVTLGWDEGPWALASGSAPRGYPRRTLRWGQALHTGLGPTLRHQSSLLWVASTPLKRPHVASARGNNAQPLKVAPSVKLTCGLACAKKHRRRRATTPDFPACTASPQGDRGTDFAIENWVGSDNIRSVADPRRRV